MPLPDGVSEHTIDTGRISMRYLEAGDADGTPVVLVHGNLSTGRFYDDQLAACPAGFRFLAPDMRGFGGSEQVAIDATRGLRDWSDDVLALMDTLGLDQPVHLAGWSTGGGAIMQLLIDAPTRVRSLTLIDPVSPYGYGGTFPDGTAATDDFAGTGGGAANPDLVARLRSGDTGAEAPTSPRNVIRGLYWSPSHRVPEPRETELVEEVLRTFVGDGGYPGDSTPSEHWPGFAPGTTGILNALSPKYLDVSGIVDVDPKPPIQWHRGSDDLVVADGAALDLGMLGQQGTIPGWPGEDQAPVQQMVSQTRAVLDRYLERGGSYEEIVHHGSGHGPHVDNAEEFNRTFVAHLQAS